MERISASSAITSRAWNISGIARSCAEKGLYVELGAFKYQVFIDFREVRDNQWGQYSKVSAFLNGHGVPDLDEAWKEILLQPLHRAFKDLFNSHLLNRIREACVSGPEKTPDRALMDEVEQKTVHFLREAQKQAGLPGNESPLAKELMGKLSTILQLPIVARPSAPAAPEKMKASLTYLRKHLSDLPAIWGTILGWLFVHAIGKLAGSKSVAEQSLIWIDEWKLERLLISAHFDSGAGNGSSRRSVQLIRLLTRHQNWFEPDRTDQNRAFDVSNSLLKDDEVRKFIQVNEHDGILWFNKESFEELLFWLMLAAVVEIGSRPLDSPAQVLKKIEACHGVIQKIQEAEMKSEYRVDKILMALKGE